mmetsp:Transcript_9349/g.27914  ORF Transcript_9349/g.27914 Transcript_9349/m.27914 type:complete len:131 (-) Transcript_9349:2274-2666(-)
MEDELHYQCLYIDTSCYRRCGSSDDSISIIFAFGDEVLRWYGSSRKKGPKHRVCLPISYNRQVNSRNRCKVSMLVRCPTSEPQQWQQCGENKSTNSESSLLCYLRGYVWHVRLGEKLDWFMSNGGAPNQS